MGYCAQRRHDYIIPEVTLAVAFRNTVLAEINTLALAPTRSFLKVHITHEMLRSNALKKG